MESLQVEQSYYSTVTYNAGPRAGTDRNSLDGGGEGGRVGQGQAQPGQTQVLLSEGHRLLQAEQEIFRTILNSVAGWSDTG